MINEEFTISNGQIKFLNYTFDVTIQRDNQNTSILNDFFFNMKKQIFILVHLLDKEGNFIIIYLNKAHIISQHKLRNYFQTINNEKNERIENSLYFSSIESKTKFKSCLSDKFQNFVELDEKYISISNENINEFRKKCKIPADNKNGSIIIAIADYVIKRSFFETKLKRKERAVKIEYTDKQFKEEDFIAIKGINNYNILAFNKNDNLLYVLRKFDNSELHTIKYFEREKICNEKLVIQHPFRPIYYGFFEKESNKSGTASNRSEPEKFLIFEYIEKIPNFKFVPSKLSEKICFILEAMISIEEIHLNDFIHRDIKLLNFIVDTNKNLVLTDRKYSTSEKEEMTSDLGSNYYASPEQNSELFYTNKTDIYSIGKLIYYMFIEITKNESPYKKPLPKEYRLFTQIYDKCTEDNPINRPNITKLINMFYKQIFKYYKSTLFYEKEEIEHMEKALKTVYEIRQKEIEVYLQNESKEYKLKHINEIFEIFEYLTYFNYINQKETLKETLSKLLEIIKEGECCLSAETLNFLGKLYNEGKYLQQDLDKSIDYFKQSSSNGCSEAQYNLGVISYINRSIGEEIDHYLESAKNNNAKAQYHLGIIYKERTDDPKNEQKSIEYFTQSAKQNHSKSQIELVKYFISKQEITDKLQQKYEDEYLTNIYKQFKFEYFTDLKKIESKNNEMKPFSMIDIMYYANDKTIVIICSYKHCYLIETNKTPDEVIKFIEDLELFYDIKFYTTNDKYSKFFDNENKFEEINTETTQLFKYFQDKHSIIYDFYFDNIEEYFINLTMKAIIGFTLRKFYFHSNEFEDKDKNKYRDLFSITNEKRREFEKDEFVNLRRIGQGSFSVVSLCYHLKTCRVYAIKEYLNPNEYDKYFQREKKFYENSKNEFIVKYYGTISRQNAFVIEYMSHGSLTPEYLSSITATQRMKLIVSILTGIKYLHSINFYHRDLKPMNIFINHDEEYFVGDFSCAKLQNPGNNNNMNSTLDFGSYVYTCSDPTFSSEEKDMYSIGIIIKEIIFNQKTKKIIPEFSIYEKDLKDFIDHCTHKNQSNEYIIIMIFYLFEMFVINEDQEFNNNFFKSYRLLFEHFILSDPKKARLVKNFIEVQNSSDIEIIINYFESLLDQSMVENNSYSTLNNIFKYLYLILGDAFYKDRFIKRNVQKSIQYFENLAKLNNSNAQYNLGIIYYKDESAPRDIQKSINYLELSAQQNNSEAQYNLGVIYSEGIDIKQDIDKAIRYFTLSANNNNTSAQYNLGIIYYEGELVIQDIDKSIYYLSMAADNYYSEAKYNLGVIYIKSDISKSIQYLTLSSNQNCSNAQFLLGTLYYEGKYVEQNIKKAIHYLTLSSSQNKSCAQYLLGMIYYERQYNPHDIYKSIHYLALAANQDHSESQYRLGMIYYEKKYILPDINKSIHYLELAAKQNHSNAQYLLGIIYYEGKYIPRDINKSIDYLISAAHGNAPNAQYILGVIYYENEFVKDINKSIYYLKLAAAGNYSDAQYFLGKIYYEGKYLTPNINKSILYLSMSANQNNLNAHNLLGKIYYEGKHIPPDINKSIHYFSLAADQSDPKALYYLGVIYYEGKYIDRDIEKSIYYLDRAAKLDDSFAQYLLGIIYSNEEYYLWDFSKSINYFMLAASKDHPYAQFLLGMIYYEGKNIKQNINKSIRYLKLAANKNVSKAQLMLGIIYYDGKYITRDIKKAIYYLSIAANQNDQKAQLNLSFIYEKGIYVPRDINKSIYYLTIAANQNNLDAQFALGTKYIIGNDFPPDIEKAIYYLKHAANKNHLEAQFYLGLIYYEGRYVYQDVHKAIYYFTLAAKQNYPKAQFNLGVIYETGKYVKCDINKAIYYFTLAAEQNYPKAQFNLGVIYETGKYVACDIDKAIYYFTLAAKQNYSDAQYKLGLIYERKYNSSFDINKAIHYLTLAANQNDIKALFKLGFMYETGNNVPQNINKSIYYYSLAANQNNPNALFSLGDIYEKGQHVPCDINRSIHYYSLAANQNHPDAQYSLGIIYYLGRKIKKDVKKGIYYIMLSSKNGNRQANFAHGFLLHEGKYIKQNIEEAIHYYKEASSFNNQYAKNNLGIIYKNGYKEVKPRIGLAIEYFKEAIGQKGDYLAMYNLAHIYIYNSEVKPNIDESIDLLIKSSKKIKFSLNLLCIALIKYCGLNLEKIMKELNERTQETNLISKIFTLIHQNSLLNEPVYECLYKSYQKIEFLYTIGLTYIESSSLGKMHKYENIQKYPNAKEISPLFYEGFSC